MQLMVNLLYEEGCILYDWHCGNLQVRVKQAGFPISEVGWLLAARSKTTNKRLPNTKFPGLPSIRINGRPKKPPT